MADAEQGDLTTLTVQLLSAYVSNNTVPANELADLIGTTRTALAGKSEQAAPEPAAQEYPRPVSIRKSLASPDFIISMIDGKPYKMLKRHLATHGLTPAEYRERYKLPKDYPIVAPTYAEQRRQTAERIGLGRGGARKASAQPDGLTVAPAKPAKPAARKAAAKPVAKVATAKAPPGKAPAKPASSPAKSATENTPQPQTSSAKPAAGRRSAANKTSATGTAEDAKTPAKRARKPSAKAKAPAAGGASE